MNSPRLRPYHNPENVDESRVPAGWRFLYADEPLTPKPSVKFWRPFWRPFWRLDSPYTHDGWVEEYPWASLDENFTYIVPVA